MGHTQSTFEDTTNVHKICLENLNEKSM